MRDDDENASTPWVQPRAQLSTPSCFGISPEQPANRLVGQPDGRCSSQQMEGTAKCGVLFAGSTVLCYAMLCFPLLYFTHLYRSLDRLIAVLLLIVVGASPQDQGECCDLGSTSTNTPVLLLWSLSFPFVLATGSIRITCAVLSVAGPYSLHFPTRTVELITSKVGSE